MELDGCWVPLREQHTGRGMGNPGHFLQLSGSWSRSPNTEHWSEGSYSRKPKPVLQQREGPVRLENMLCMPENGQEDLGSSLQHLDVAVTKEWCKSFQEEAQGNVPTYCFTLPQQYHPAWAGLLCLPKCERLDSPYLKILGFFNRWGWSRICLPLGTKWNSLWLSQGLCNSNL